MWAQIDTRKEQQFPMKEGTQKESTTMIIFIVSGAGKKSTE